MHSPRVHACSFKAVLPVLEAGRAEDDAVARDHGGRAGEADRGRGEVLARLGLRVVAGAERRAGSNVRRKEKKRARGQKKRVRCGWLRGKKRRLI